MTKVLTSDGRDRARAWRTILTHLGYRMKKSKAKRNAQRVSINPRKQTRMLKSKWQKSYAYKPRYAPLRKSKVKASDAPADELGLLAAA